MCSIPITKDIQGCELKMKNLRENEQFNYILNEINTHTILGTDRKNILANVFNFIIAGKRVCYGAWCLAYNITGYGFKEAITELKGNWNLEIRERKDTQQE